MTPVEADTTIEDTIQRAKAAPYGTSEGDLMVSLVESGVSPEDAFLAIKAASVLLSPFRGDS